MALLDLGFSSYQLADESRGFSYIGPDSQPLDMRFDAERDRTELSSAFDIVNSSTELELSEVFKKFGEERFHSDLARKIIQYRQQPGRGAIATTGDLKQAIREAFPNSAKDERNHMIKRAF
jgi:16S rRNA (cytosine1402-N4)-methyltransferase